MPTQLEIRPEIAHKLAALAKRRGMSVDDLLQEALVGMEMPQDASTGTSLEEFERDIDTLSDGLDHLPVGYHGTYSREDIYMDHE